MKYKIGIDVGGTFTDFFLVADNGDSIMHKTLSTPEDSSIGFITGLTEIADKLSLPETKFIDNIDTIVHGTTVATNALLTLGGAKTALLTTKGFRDALEMRRGVREERYNNRFKNVTPLVPRYLRYTVDERIDAEGKITNKIDYSELDVIISKIKEEEVQAVAVCFMNSYLNNENEKRAVEYLRKKLPEIFISASYEVLPSVRFYERVSTTVVNAYISVVVGSYLVSLIAKLEKLNFSGKLMIMQSNGGVVTPEIARKASAVTVLSGPAAAPIAGAYYAELLGYDNCITMDMGGTSFDTSLVVNKQCITSTEADIDRYHVGLPTLDIITIGAGGGSIGWVDSGGLLQMGPKSAGSLPGPISYNKGGKKPTCTDADLILGYLDPDYFAGGKYVLNKDKTLEVTKKILGEQLDLNTQETAAGMYRVINMNMAQGVRQVSVERGYDPREFLMICAGGAGSIHAGEICRELEIPMFVVPGVAPIFCAAGMLLGDLKHDFVRSYLSKLSLIEKAKFMRLFDEMKAEAKTTLIAEGISEDKIQYVPSLDVRYVGQYHEVPLEVTMENIYGFNLEAIKDDFHKEHNRQFGYELKDEGTELEIINLRFRAIGITEKPHSLSGNIEHGVSSLKEALKGKRLAYVPEKDKMQEVPVYNGDLLSSNFKINGPAIIEQVNTTIFVGENYNCETGIGGAFIVYNNRLMPEGFNTKSHNQKKEVQFDIN